MAFLDNVGLTHLWGIIEDRLTLKVDKVAGKDLSTNDYTDADKAKLASLYNTLVANSTGITVTESTDSESGAKTFTISIDSSVVQNSALETTLQNYAKKSDIANALNFMGSVNSRSLLPTDPKKGDVYDIVDENGMNVAWTGEKWDNLGATFQVEAITNAEIDAIISAAQGG